MNALPPYHRPDHTLKSARPLVPVAPSPSEAEQFQNEVIRPIVKMQHDLIMAFATKQDHLQRAKAMSRSAHDFMREVKVFVQNQPWLKHQLIGCVIGMMTVEEFQRYEHMATELNKRIVSIIVQRIADTLFKA
jgi:hypothetical protein